MRKAGFDRKRREAWPSATRYIISMIDMTLPHDPAPAMPDARDCWDAFLKRDRTMDGRFVGAVLTTGVYCKPSCAARHPRRENMIFLPTPADARAAGFRACLRCRPDEIGRDRQAVQTAIALIERAERALSLGQIAAEAGYAPHHFHRLFKRETGLTPAAYARGLRADRLKDALKEQSRVTKAIYDAGYGAASRAYADAVHHLGMTPSAWKAGGRGVIIRYHVTDSALGPVLVAATDKGLCRISFDEGLADLQRRFPKAEIQEADARMLAISAQVARLIDKPSAVLDLPIDAGGTAFQQAVWSALRAIPPGETRTYSEIAAAVGRPAAVRAAGSACGDNGLAVLIPCHRVLRSDGSLGGYAYGLERKRALLDREKNG